MVPGVRRARMYCPWRPGGSRPHRESSGIQAFRGRAPARAEHDGPRRESSGFEAFRGRAPTRRTIRGARIPYDGVPHAVVDRDPTGGLGRRDPASPSMHDAAFSEVVERAMARGCLREGPAARDRRTRMLELTHPGRMATQIARSIHGQLEANVATGQDLLTRYDTLVRLDRSLQIIERPGRLDDGLPVTTA